MADNVTTPGQYNRGTTPAPQGGFIPITPGVKGAIDKLHDRVSEGHNTPQPSMNVAALRTTLDEIVSEIQWASDRGIFRQWLKNHRWM